MVPDRGILVVADGMGGHAAGEVASEMAVRFVARELGSLKSLSDDQVADRMRTSIRAANGAIFQRTLTEHDKRGMGTTVTALVLYDTRFLIGQVGDSRAYLYRDQKLLQLTKDHSYVQEQVDAGYLTPEQARSHPYSNVITRCVGANSDVMPDVYLGTVKPRDRFLLASDGLTGMLEDPQLAELLAADRMPQEQVDDLITEANRHGGPGNITGIIIPADSVDATGGGPPRNTPPGARPRRDPGSPGGPVFPSLEQGGVVGRPRGRVGGQLGGREVERPLRETALAETAGEAGHVLLQQLVDQPAVGGDRDGVRPHSTAGDGAAHETLEHRGGAPHRVVPVHVAIHLILGEQQRLERREALLMQRQRGMPVATRGQGQRREQPVHVDHAVGHAAHPGVAGPIVELVHVERARHQTGEGLAGPALDQGQ